MRLSTRQVFLQILVEPVATVLLPSGLPVIALGLYKPLLFSELFWIIGSEFLAKNPTSAGPINPCNPKLAAALNVMRDVVEYTSPGLKTCDVSTLHHSSTCSVLSGIEGNYHRPASRSDLVLKDICTRILLFDRGCQQLRLK